MDKYLSNFLYDTVLDACAAIQAGRLAENKDPDPKFVCIKDTYPEYEMVWKAIEERMTKT